VRIEARLNDGVATETKVEPLRVTSEQKKPPPELAVVVSAKQLSSTCWAP
jgi:hypothetical protein